MRDTAGMVQPCSRWLFLPESVQEELQGQLWLLVWSSSPALVSRRNGGSGAPVASLLPL